MPAEVATSIANRYDCKAKGDAQVPVPCCPVLYRMLCSVQALCCDMKAQPGLSHHKVSRFVVVAGLDTADLNMHALMGAACRQ